MPGQVDLEGRPFARFAVDVDEPVVLLDDAVDCGQPQAGAPIHTLGGEKRFENIVQYFLVHAAAVVADGQQDKLAGNKTGVIGAVGLVEGMVSCFDDDLAHTFDGVTGVDAQVGQDLLDLGGVHLYGPQARPRQPGKIDLLADEALEHFKHTFHVIVQVDHLGGDGLPTGKGQQLPGDARYTFCGREDFIEIGT